MRIALAILHADVARGGAERYSEKLRVVVQGIEASNFRIDTSMSARS